MTDFGNYDDFKKEAEKTGYNINKDEDFVQALLDSINININRYGYGACPCRLASGNKEKDLDIICPCDYRDSDLSDFGACFCALYVSDDVLNGKIKLESIRDRRMEAIKSKKESKPPQDNLHSSNNGIAKLKVPIWRCKVCGYLCGKEKPPGKCPICKATSKRFEQIL
jgi:ferredoxin-thioredoxin reductase catalytic subunit